MLFQGFTKHPIVNFGKGCWGQDWYVDRISGRNVGIHGWCPLSFRGMLKKGALIIKESEDGFCACRLKSIEWMDDPTDMFFAKVKWCTKTRHFTKDELNFIDRNLPQYVRSSKEVDI